MADQGLVEPHPDYTPLCDFVGDTFCGDDSLIVSTISSVASQASLGGTNTAVPGRLLGRVEAYLEAGTSEYFLETIRYGHKLVFEKDTPPPPPCDFRPKNKSALSRPSFLYDELLHLEQLGCTRRINFRSHIVNPCSVVFSKKWRCVLDASICLSHLKMGGAHSQIYIDDLISFCE